LQAKSGSEANLYEVIFPNGVFWKPVEGTYPRLNKESLLKAYDEGRLWFGKNGKNVPRLKKYLSEVKQGIITNSLWLNSEVGSTQGAKENLKKLIGQNIFETPKPEALLQKIIQIGTNEGDIILDYHLGSGTTCAVAHKMGRQYIGIEQMDYIENITCERLKKVIAGEQGGISKSVNWQGGGSFVYMELKEWNQKYMQDIQEANNTQTLLNIYEQMKKEAFFRYQIDISKFDDNQFSELSLNDQKKVLFQCLDKNHLYVNINEIEDTTYNISAEEQKLNKSFYKKI